MIQPEQVEYQIEPWMEELYRPHRYKIIYGGRASGKSYAVADALLIISCSRKCLIFCGRELKKSIHNSVHLLLKQRIKALNLSDRFDTPVHEIRNKVSGSKFIFDGVRHNIESIKSIPEITHFWIEEANTLSAESLWTILPTIRENDSEFWATMNPKNFKDILYKEFIAGVPPANSYVKKVNWRDNPHFPEVLRPQIERDKLRNYALYLHIWEGQCLVHSDAQIFKDKWTVGKFEEPKGVHKYYGLDFGFSQDPTAAICCYVHDNILYISHEAVKVNLEIDHIQKFIKEHLPDVARHTIYADSARPDTISFLKRQGLSIKAVKKGKGSVEDGIAYIRSFEQIIIHERCSHTIDEFLNYSYKEDPRSGDITNTIIDKYNHSIDALRYALERSMMRQGCNYKNWDMTALNNISTGRYNEKSNSRTLWF